MLKSWEIPTHQPCNPVMKIFGDSLEEAVDARIEDLVLMAQATEEHSQRTVSLPDSAYLHYSNGIFGGTGGVVALIDCVVSNSYAKDSEKYNQYPYQYEIWIKAKESDLEK